VGHVKTFLLNWKKIFHIAPLTSQERGLRAFLIGLCYFGPPTKWPKKMTVLSGP
jgi:hypothetical protein